MKHGHRRTQSAHIPSQWEEPHPETAVTLRIAHQPTHLQHLLHKSQQKTKTKVLQVEPLHKQKDDPLFNFGRGNAKQIAINLDPLIAIPQKMKPSKPRTTADSEHTARKPKTQTISVNKPKPKNNSQKQSKPLLNVEKDYKMYKETLKDIGSKNVPKASKNVKEAPKKLKQKIRRISAWEPSVGVKRHKKEQSSLK